MATGRGREVGDEPVVPDPVDGGREPGTDGPDPRRCGIDATAAALTAETGVAVFRVAFAGWIAEGEQRSLAELQRMVLAELRALVSTAS